MVAAVAIPYDANPAHADMLRRRWMTPWFARFGRLPWRDPNTRFLGLAVLVGLLGAAAASVFRFASAQITRLVTGHTDIVAACASLPLGFRIALPAAGGLVGGFIARRLVRTGGTMGIAQIME